MPYRDLLFAGILVTLCASVLSCTKPSESSESAAVNASDPRFIIGGVSGAGGGRIFRVEVWTYHKVDPTAKVLEEDDGFSASKTGWYRRGGCTSVAIAENKLLSASHCILALTPDVDGVPRPPKPDAVDSIYIGAETPAAGGGIFGKIYSETKPVQPLTRVTGIQLLLGLATARGAFAKTINDGLLLLTLADKIAVPATVTSEAPRVGEWYTLMGFSKNEGATGGAGPHYNAQANLWMGRNRLHSFTAADNDRTLVFQAWAGQTAGPENVLLDGGDSGGPSFDENGHVAGIASNGSAAVSGSIYSADSRGAYLDLCAPSVRDFLKLAPCRCSPPSAAGLCCQFPDSSYYWDPKQDCSPSTTISTAEECDAPLYECLSPTPTPTATATASPLPASTAMPSTPPAVSTVPSPQVSISPAGTMPPSKIGTPIAPMPSALTPSVNPSKILSPPSKSIAPAQSSKGTLPGN